MNDRTSPAESKVGAEGFSYASKQATACAGCGMHKHTPLRIDWMGGYVCLTCIDRELESRSPAMAAEPTAWFEAEESARNLPLRSLLTSVVHSTRWHMQTHCPETDNPVWPIFTGPILPPAHTVQKWSKEPPTEQGLYWHWTGDLDSGPIPLNVLWSGSTKKCFVSIGQYGIAQAVDCDKYGGYWQPAIEPEMDDEIGYHGSDA
ncbi:hypothetical protein [Burkholderia sp. MBR-1]|uniref:hypothetical protein n=1 Tax=Burkholderia sp. MBR-1 TaxID=2732364 RepID=UPI0015EF2F99|nr:hypothetical protein [Burkholderia sp. MBR-1]QMI49675.1 hypothetical protein MBR110_29950 [Burkholderia sp. MBR-1]